MNKTISYLFFVAASILLGCNTHQVNFAVEKKTVKDSILNQTENKLNLVSITALQGVWAESEEENAIFFIRNDSLYYTEHQDNPVKLKIYSDTLLIMGAIPVHCKILKLTKDSLCYVDEFNDMPTRLYKRK